MVMKFHGEYQMKLKIEVVVEAENLAEAQQKVKQLCVTVDDEDGVMPLSWDVEPEAIYLFEGAE